MSSRDAIRLPEPVHAALQEAAKREHKSLEEMAGELIMRGLIDKREWRGLIRFGHEQGVKSGVVDEDVPEMVHEWREKNRQHSR